VYVVIAVLLIAGNQLPEIPFVEVVVSGGIVAPEQYGPTCGKDGRIFGIIVKSKDSVTQFAVVPI
jgi:hypothetical protein